MQFLSFVAFMFTLVHFSLSEKIEVTSMNPFFLSSDKTGQSRVGILMDPQYTVILDNLQDKDLISFTPTPSEMYSKIEYSYNLKSISIWFEIKKMHSSNLRGFKILASFYTPSSGRKSTAYDRRAEIELVKNYDQKYRATISQNLSFLDGREFFLVFRLVSSTGSAIQIEGMPGTEYEIENKRQFSSD